MKLQDEATRVFLNTHGKNKDEVSPELRELLYYMEHANEEGLSIESERIRDLRDSVRTIQKDVEKGVKYMQAWEEMALARKEGHEEGIEIGESRGREEGIRIGQERGIEQGREQGMDTKGIAVFKNCVSRGMPRKDAQAIAEISDELAEAALKEL